MMEDNRNLVIRCNQPIPGHLVWATILVGEDQAEAENGKQNMAYNNLKNHSMFLCIQVSFDYLSNYIQELTGDIGFLPNVDNNPKLNYLN